MMIPEGVTVRAPVPDDAEALAWLQIDVWEDAYADLMPAAVFDERRATIGERIDRWHRILVETPSRTTVAELSGDLIGFVSVGPPRADPVDVDEELWALYVRSSWWGRSVGHALLGVALADRPAYLWVLRGNDRAIAFYRRRGFAEDGTTRTDEHGTELRMIRRGGRAYERHEGPVTED